MVQKEVKKKTSVYASAAVLMAIVLVSMVYVFGSAPLVFPPSGSPVVGGMRTFGSTQEIKDYLNSNSADYSYSNYYGGPIDSQFFGSTTILRGQEVRTTGTMSGTDNSYGVAEMNPPSIYSSNDFSTTNIQVAGVDEADTVKTDGSYIYTVSNAQNSGYYYSTYATDSTNAVYILNVNPQDAKVISKIALGNNTEPAGLFLSSDGNKLVILASKYQTYYGNYRLDGRELAPMIMPSRQSDVYTYIDVYDVSNKASPVLTRNFTVSGSYFNSRLIGNNLYAVVSQTAWVYNDLVSLPAVYEGSSKYESLPSSIYYADMNDTSYTFTSFYGVNIQDASVAPTNMTVLMGGASAMYVSTDNIYVTYPDWDQNIGQYTSIYRVGIDGLELTFEAQGSVPGSTLNQYSMDEYSGHFRIATNYYATESQISNVYILNSNLNITGKLEGLAPNENLHSVRFMGDKCYLVTYRTTDPLFVIDLSDSTNPHVLGELKIPGYSDYLHPYDNTHLIGVGKEAVEVDGGSFAYYQGLKLALFDVGDVNNPKQLSNVTIGDRGTDSLALSDPKAFLFDKSKNLLVIPVSLAVVSDADKALYGVSAYGTTVWQGAYVYSLSVDGGFTLKGTVTHLSPALLNNQGYLTNTNDYYNTQNQTITRSLYIDNTLYTVSNSEVKLNSLTNLSEIATVNLS